jgi:hypothetical protein
MMAKVVDFKTDQHGRCVDFNEGLTIFQIFNEFMFRYVDAFEKVGNSPETITLMGIDDHDLDKLMTVVLDIVKERELDYSYLVNWDEDEE